MSKRLVVPHRFIPYTFCIVSDMCLVPVFRRCLYVCFDFRLTKAAKGKMFSSKWEEKPQRNQLILSIRNPSFKNTSICHGGRIPNSSSLNKINISLNSFPPAPDFVIILPFPYPLHFVLISMFILNAVSPNSPPQSISVFGPVFSYWFLYNFLSLFHQSRHSRQRGHSIISENKVLAVGR